MLVEIDTPLGDLLIGEKDLSVIYSAKSDVV